MSVRLFEAMPSRPIITIAQAMKLLETTRPTVAKAVRSLTEAGILVESSGRKRDRTFAYPAYLDLLKTGTEL